jgi:hypothetical protein
MPPPRLDLVELVFGYLRSEVATAPSLGAVLGDPGAEVGCTLADGAGLRMIADRAAVAHRERVLPGFDKRLELRS